MAFEEKRAWMMGVVAIAAYAVYATVILRRAGDGIALTEVPYASTLLWSIGAAIVASIVLHIVISIFSYRDADKQDVRDKEIGKYSSHISQSFVVIGGVSAMLMALAEWGYFWIANIIYLCFVLSAVLESIAKVTAYRRGFQKW